MVTGTTNLSNFVKSSMLINELNNEKEYINNELNELIEKEKVVNKGLDMLHTKRIILSEYNELLNKMIPSNKKKRKQHNRILQNMKDSYKNLEKDYSKWLNWEKIKEEIVKLERNLKNLDSYIDSEINTHFRILKENNFIDDNDKLTNKGIIAANLHEIHSLAMSDIIEGGELDDLTPEELVSVLSIITGIRLNDQNKYHSMILCQVNDKIKNTVDKIEQSLNKYNSIETSAQTNFSQSYDIQYDMCEFMYKWCFAENNVDCRKIYDEAKSYDIYMGEFVKAVLKIVNICNELEKVCSVVENVKLMHTLSQVKEKLLKSIATNQSLYL